MTPEFDGIEVAAGGARWVNGQLPLITIVVPVFNEEDNVDRTYAELKRVTAELPDYRFEFLFTDNRSTDHTFEKLSRIASEDADVRVVRFSRNFGFQRSVLAGYRLARGVAAIQIDADLQDPPAMFGPFLEKWKEGFDVVVGVRRQRQESAVLKQGRQLYYRLLRRLDGPHLIVDAGDFRLIDRAVIERLRLINEPHMYLRGLISSLARRQTGIPYNRSRRDFNESKFPLRALTRLAADGIIAHSSFPLKVSFYVGIVIALASTLLAFFYLALRAWMPDAVPPGFTTTQILLLLGIGLNSTFLGILGVYVGRIYDQVRTRPMVVISDLLNFDQDIGSV
ncbi:glycosyltransferase family 2 protein [Hydrogenophaga sp.]|uniref:glycosyltransferase family 2 protein n=1 Tax=Hydrogenophaga sp. TaxID=1904254 RepID=UPI002728DF26|nr:glycosyltransferase family 2 protein [Hydrogenophaga sp.]MDO9436516.1 glycosyltransferase family 2 protein [Hydrogenophaga sp.]